MILYVNGDSHSAGAEAVNPYGFAEDDPLYWALGRRPHPDNERASYGCQLANMMNAILICDAESASSNSRIIRTTLDYLENNDAPDLVVIGWSSWEREEWWDEETQRFWQVNAGGIGNDWPESIRSRYKEWIVSVNWQQKTQEAHIDIWQFHQLLELQDINHYFFNCFQSFSTFVPLTESSDWDSCYLGPYDNDHVYYNWLINKGYKTVYPGSYHFGADAHYAWAEFLFQNLVQKNLTQ